MRPGGERTGEPAGRPGTAAPHLEEQPGRGTTAQQERPRATIVMRARDEAPRIGRALEVVFRQQGVELEVVCVDSGSTDGTLEIVRRHPLKLIEVPPESFTYGTALNLGAAAGSGEFVVCLNADAEPADDRWLIELLRPLLVDPRVAAAYSRQLPRVGAHPTVLRDYAWAFGERTPAIDPPFFSMVSSAYRRRLWEAHPFWSGGGAGDDTEWVRWALLQGWKAAYAPRSAVIHSHNYTALGYYRKLLREQRMHVELYGPCRQWRTPAILARLASDLVKDARFLARRGELGKLPLASAQRLMQAAGRLHGYLSARPARNGRAGARGGR